MGFIAARWVRTFCNLPSVCEALSLATPLLAALYLAAFLATWRDLRAPALRPLGARLLALTAVSSVAADLLDAVAPHFFWYRTSIVEGLDLLAWVWALVGTLAAARWVWGGMPAIPLAGGGLGAPHRFAATVLIVLVIGLQLVALYRPGAALWPFVGYQLYTAAHGPPAQTVVYRMHGAPARAPDTEIEIPSYALGMRWYPYHHHFVPALFHTPSEQVLDDLHQRLRRSSVPRLQTLVVERKTYVLEGSELKTFVERRSVPLRSMETDRAIGRQSSGLDLDDGSRRR